MNTRAVNPTGASHGPESVRSAKAQARSKKSTGAPFSLALHAVRGPHEPKPTTAAPAHAAAVPAPPGPNPSAVPLPGTPPRAVAVPKRPKEPPQPASRERGPSEPPGPVVEQRTASPFTASPSPKAPPRAAAGSRVVVVATSDRPASRVLRPQGTLLSPQNRARASLRLRARPVPAPPASATETPHAPKSPPVKAGGSVLVPRRSNGPRSAEATARAPRPLALTPETVPAMAVPVGRTPYADGPRPAHPPTVGATGSSPTPLVAPETTVASGWRVEGLTTRGRTVRFRIKPPTDPPIAVRMADHTGRTDVTLTVPTASWQHALAPDSHLLALRLEAMHLPPAEVSVGLAGRFGSGSGDHAASSAGQGRHAGGEGSRLRSSPDEAPLQSGALNLLA